MSLDSPRRGGRPRRVPDVNGMLHCPDCNQDKYPDEFRRVGDTGRYESYCRPCKNIRHRRYAGRSSQHDADLERAEAWEQYLLAQKRLMQWIGDEDVAGPSTPAFLPEMTPELLRKMQEQGIRMGPPDDGVTLEKLRSLLDEGQE